jgi:hypothetical protein
VITGGTKLEAHLKGLAKKLSNAKSVKVGFLEGATYPDGTPVAMVAAIQNFGAPAVGIPPRPFFSNMVREKGPNWGKSLSEILKAQKMDAAKSLALTGKGIEGQLHQSIVDTNAPPLAKATIAAKGFDKPLVDTGHMLNSINSEVEA